MTDKTYVNVKNYLEEQENRARGANLRNDQNKEKFAGS